jgi:glycosyltransferase involved in cell wall biosynthesis
VSFAVFHPSVAPFVQQAARALHETGQLARFETALCDDPGGWSQRLAINAARLVGRDLAAQFRRRAVTEIPSHLIRSHPWGEYARLAVGALDRDGRATDLVWEKTEHGFDRAVSRSLDRSLSGVYGFEHSSFATFRRAREFGLRVVYDVPAPDSEFTHQLLDRELERFPELRTPYRHHTAAREHRRLARRRDEWRAADLVIAASEFTKRSYAEAGLDVSKVHVVPYGAPPSISSAQALTPRDTSARLTFIWAGTFSIRKGAHYLLEAWRHAQLGRHARLKVFGAMDLPEGLVQPLPAGLTLHGSIPRDRLLEEYRQADALIFPTLCDGFGMVVTEAWSQGLPVITTSCAGAADLLKPGENGLIIPAGNSEAVAQVVQWCLDHRNELAAMRESALATAARWQWSDYRRALAAALLGAGLFPCERAS